MTTATRYAMYVTMWAAIHAAHSAVFWWAGVAVTVVRIVEEVRMSRAKRDAKAAA